MGALNLQVMEYDRRLIVCTQ